MAKKKATKIEKVKHIEPTPTNEQEVRLDKQLTAEQYEDLSEQLDDFHESFLSFLAGTAKFELIPTTDESGQPIPEKNLELIRRECARLGLKVLYTVDCGKHTLVINPDTMKIAVVQESLETH